MFKFVVLFAAIACTMAAPKPGLHASPLVVAAPVVSHSVPVATSYANTYKVDYKSAPLVAAAPVAYTAHASPVAYTAHASPIAYTAHASPLAYTAHAAPAFAYSAHPAPLSYAHAAPVHYLR